MSSNRNRILVFETRYGGSSPPAAAMNKLWFFILNFRKDGNTLNFYGHFWGNADMAIKAFNAFKSEKIANGYLPFNQELDDLTPVLDSLGVSVTEKPASFV